VVDGVDHTETKQGGPHWTGGKEAKEDPPFFCDTREGCGWHGRREKNQGVAALKRGGEKKDSCGEGWGSPRICGERG